MSKHSGVGVSARSHGFDCQFNFLSERLFGLGLYLNSPRNACDSAIMQFVFFFFLSPHWFLAARESTFCALFWFCFVFLLVPIYDFALVARMQAAAAPLWQISRLVHEVLLASPQPRVPLLFIRLSLLLAMCLSAG